MKPDAKLHTKGGLLIAAAASIVVQIASRAPTWPGWLS